MKFFKKAFENRFGATNQQLNSIFANIEEVERLSRHILKNLLIEYAKPRHTQNFATTFLRLVIFKPFPPFYHHNNYYHMISISHNHFIHILETKYTGCL